MYDYLVEHAFENVWCNPSQDTQFIIAPYRISKPVGVLNQCTVMGRQFNLPTKNSYYHIYQIGQLNPILLGLMPNNPVWSRDIWIKLSDCCINTSMIANVYTEAGISIPLQQVYYLVSSENNLIIAVMENPRIRISYRTDTIYLRVYSNAYFNSPSCNVESPDVWVGGKICTSSHDILTLQSKFLHYQSEIGYTTAFVNGVLVNTIDLINTAINDIVEIVYDSSVYKVIELPIVNLPTYESVLDKSQKYLLQHHDMDQYGIDYVDDIDLYIISDRVPNHTNGIYYHKNLPSNLRMVTHKDYSVPVSKVNYYLNVFTNIINTEYTPLTNSKIMMVIRRSGYHRPLVYENDRIHELYKLPFTNITQALLGVNSVVSNWTASHLENSGYCRIMREEPKNIIRELVVNSYGYNALSQLLGDTPAYTYLYSGKQQRHLPYGLQNNSTIYEYDCNGYMLAMSHHPEGTIATATCGNTALIEAISGYGTHSPDVFFGTDSIPLPIYDNYRVYKCHIHSGEWDNKWEDVTHGEDYSVVNNTLIGNDNDYDRMFMVRTDRTFLAYDLNIYPTDGLLMFDLSEMETRLGVENHHILPVRLGQLVIFLNRKSLIYGLDYVLNFPKVVILNKKYLTENPNTTQQHIHIRYTGFSDGELQVADDVGWIDHGVLSRNKVFNIRDDRVLRIVVGGQVMHRTALKFSENDSVIRVTDRYNGLPYCIDDIIVPLKDIAGTDTYALRRISKDIDQRISQYLSTILPEKQPEAPSAIPERYPLVSPFICKILYDLFTEHLMIDGLTLTDTQLLEICHPYEYLLEYDPINPTLGFDHDYVIIHPHNSNLVLELNLYRYRFLTRVIGIYANGLISISPFVSLTEI